MYYDRETNIVHILYQEKKGKGKTISHRFEGEPIFLQYDPRDSKKIQSVHFNVAAPIWMEYYASMNRIEFEEANLDGEGEGFSLTEVATNSTDALTIEGKIHEWFKVALGSYDEIKSALLANSLIVDNNLRYYPECFEPYGLKARVSEFDPNYYSINYSDIKPIRDINFNRFPNDCEERDEVIKLNEKWHKLKDDLITVREYPPTNHPLSNEDDVPIAEPSNDIEVPTIDLSSIEIELPTVVTPSIEVEERIIEEVSMVDLSSIEIELPTVVAPSNKIEIPTIDLSSVEIEVPTVVAPSIEIEVPTAEIPSIETEYTTVEESSNDVETSFVKAETIEHLIVKKSSKKAGLISGQVLLF